MALHLAAGGRYDHTMENGIPLIDLGTLAYRPAWDKQLEIHAQVTDGTLADGALIVVEHPPVVTLGRRPNAEQNLLASRELLAARGVELVETDRGGDITFHGPGQLVAYPIVPLNTYGLNLHAYMRLLEQVVIDTLATFGVAGERSEGATGVWVKPPAVPGGLVPPAAKVCAMGVKIRRWVSFHGIALNVTTDMAYFGLINPCGLGRPVTSLQALLGPKCPTMAEVKIVLHAQFRRHLVKPIRPENAAGEASAAEPIATPSPRG